MTTSLTVATETRQKASRGRQVFRQEKVEEIRHPKTMAGKINIIFDESSINLLGSDSTTNN